MQKNNGESKKIFLAIILAALFSLSEATATRAATLELPDYGQPVWNGPPPGSVYKEYRVLSMPFSGAVIMENSAIAGNEWRVTDPAATYGARDCSTSEDKNIPACFLPNVKFRIDNLETANALKAEIFIDHWSGHAGTRGRGLLVNDNNKIDLPLGINGITSGAAENYLAENIISKEIPLAWLNSGSNNFRFTCGDGTPFWWGQWGWYDLRLRVYYNPGSVPHPTGQIILPAQGASIDENPAITASATAAAGSSIEQVDFFSVYYGVDENGDGHYYDIHEMFHKGNLSGHIGTDTSGPSSYSVVWDTSRVPNQKKNGVQIFARIKSNGFWYVTEPKTGISLNRTGGSVIMLPATSVPENFNVRDGQSKSSYFQIPNGLELGGVNGAQMFLRSWNLRNNEQEAVPYTLNNNSIRSVTGPDHDFAFNFFDLAKSELRSGSNSLTFSSTTQHHGAEILWPGPSAVLTSSQPVCFGLECEDLPEISGSYSVTATVGAGGVRRENKVIDVPLDITQKLRDLGKQGKLEKINGVSEINSSGAVIDADVPFQFDPDPQFNNLSNASGNLVLQLKGVTEANQERLFRISIKLGGSYTASANPANPQLVSLEENSYDEGQDSFKITTGKATYFYHKLGGGFSSILDKGGQDWLNYNPNQGSGSAGEYRGIPNMVYVQSSSARSFFHPGFTNSSSAITSAGKLKATLESQSDDGQWKVRWEIYPERAKMTLLQRTSGDKYWFLYEGTPGGRFDVNDKIVRANGTTTNLSQTWEGDLAGEEWLYFASQGKSLFAAHHEDDNLVEGYWPMDNNMTVFGFGRASTGSTTHLSAVPATFSIGLIDTVDYNQAGPLIRASYKDMSITAGSLQAADSVSPAAPTGLSVR